MAFSASFHLHFVGSITLCQEFQPQCMALCKQSSFPPILCELAIFFSSTTDQLDIAVKR